MQHGNFEKKRALAGQCHADSIDRDATGKPNATEMHKRQKGSRGRLRTTLLGTSLLAVVALSPQAGYGQIVNEELAGMLAAEGSSPAPLLGEPELFGRDESPPIGLESTERSNLTTQKQLDLSFFLAAVNTEQQKSAKKVEIDTRIPDSPAFAALGVTPSSITRPTSGRDFFGSVLNGLDENGNLQAGWAVEAKLINLLDEEVTLAEYRQGCTPETDPTTNKTYLDCDFSWDRFLSRTSISFATVEGKDISDKARRASIGIRFTPFDAGDPRLDLNSARCTKSELSVSVSRVENLERSTGNGRNNSQGSNESGQGDGSSSDLEAALASANQLNLERVIETLDLDEQCLGSPDESNQNWNKSAWSLGIAPTLIAENGQFGDLQFEGLAAWTGIAYGFDQVDYLRDNAQFLLQFQYRKNEVLPVASMTGDMQAMMMDDMMVDMDAGDDVASMYFRQNRLQTAARFTMGRPTLNFSIEGSYNSTKPENMMRDKFWSYAASTDFRIIEGVYLNATYSDTSGRDMQEDEDRFIVSFKITPGAGGDLIPTNLLGLFD